jgi:hypothetical protein
MSGAADVIRRPGATFAAPRPDCPHRGRLVDGPVKAPRPGLEMQLRPRQASPGPEAGPHADGQLARVTARARTWEYSTGYTRFLNGVDGRNSHIPQRL